MVGVVVGVKGSVVVPWVEVAGTGAVLVSSSVVGSSVAAVVGESGVVVLITCVAQLEF